MQTENDFLVTMSYYGHHFFVVLSTKSIKTEHSLLAEERDDEDERKR